MVPFDLLHRHTIPERNPLQRVCGHDYVVHVLSTAAVHPDGCHRVDSEEAPHEVCPRLGFQRRFRLHFASREDLQYIVLCASRKIKKKKNPPEKLQVL